MKIGYGQVELDEEAAAKAEISNVVFDGPGFRVTHKDPSKPWVIRNVCIRTMPEELRQLVSRTSQLERYARHDPGCGTEVGGVCACGLQALLDWSTRVREISDASDFPVNDTNIFLGDRTTDPK